MKEYTLNEWKEKFLNGDFESKSKIAQIDAGWYDWWCLDNALSNKTKSLGNKAIQLFDSPKLDKEKYYIWFKNNCPAVGPLYDDFRFSDIETGDVKFTISNIKKGCYGKDFSGWEVFDVDKREYVVRGKWKDVKNYFLKAE